MGEGQVGCVVHVTSEGELRGAVEGWIADDPDAGDRAELRGLLERAFGGRVTRRVARIPGRWRSCGTGSRGGWSSGRPGCGGSWRRGRTG